ncbi:MAG: M42 family peptidase [Ruminococcus sp.]|nr:M42 family peptidase [Ruminococcus sp.]
MDIKETVIALSESYGASGSENGTAELAVKMLGEYCCDAQIRNGNVVGSYGEYKEGAPLLLIDAHLDQIGMIVSYITDDGFIKVGNLGGLDRRLLPAQQVVIHGKEKIKGVICSVPPHLSSGESAVQKIDDIAIDTGMSKEELESIVSLGDSITFDVKCKELLGNRITGGALDDRCGIASILYALELLEGAKLRYNVKVLFSAQEELGERGAKIGAYEINPDEAIAVDVSFGYTVSEIEHKCGHLGKGAMIGISPSLSREVSEGLIECAKRENIPYQLEIMNGLTSTNADRFSVNREGAKACTLSIPLRYMHTPVEVIDIEDVKLTGKLLASYIREAE